MLKKFRSDHQEQSDMNRTHATALAAVLFASSLTAFGGEALDIELPSMRTPAPAGTLSRDDVRADLAMARAQGMLDAAGEAGATPDVLLARQRFNQTQERVLLARYELQREPTRLHVAAVPSEGDVLLIVEPDASGRLAAVEMIDYD
jgi:hypothetical protein